MQNFDTKRTSDVPKRIDDEEGDWDFEGLVTAKKIATTGTRSKLREV